MKGNKKNYQLVMVFNPKTDEKEKEQVFATLDSWGKSNKVDVGKKDGLGVMELSYPIKGLDKGDYWVVNANTTNIVHLKEINLYLNRNSNIIRYLILKV